MPRKRKTHILKGEDVSWCNRRAVEIVADRTKATCAACQQAIARGAEDRELAKQAPSPTDGNRKGVPKYTEKQRAFAAHPAVTTNAYQAAIDVGYSRATAKTQANALRRQLAPLIIENQERAKARSAISVARVQTELAHMGFANVIDYFHIDDNGKTRPKQLNELTREQAAAIQEVEVIDYQDADTGETFFVIGKLKLADKRANLVELGKTMGMFNNKITIEDKRESSLLLGEVPTDALEDAEKLLMNAVSVARSQKSNNNAIEGEYTKIEGPTSAKTDK